MSNVPGGDSSPRRVTLAATDPAQPYGGVLPWPDNPGRPTRAAGCRVILSDGVPQAFVDRAGRQATIFDGADLGVVAAGLTSDVAARIRRMELAQVNGAPVSGHPLAGELVALKWKLSYRGLRPPQR